MPIEEREMLKGYLGLGKNVFHVSEVYKTTVAIICATAVLHNIGLRENLDNFEDANLHIPIINKKEEG